MTPVYLEIAPAPALAPFVRTYRIVQAAGSVVSRAPVMRTMPDGCVEVVFNSGAPIVDMPRLGESATKPRFFIMGALSRTRLAEAHGAIDAVSVLFHPGAAGPFLCTPAKALSDAVLEANDFCSFADSALAARLSSTNDPMKRVHLLELALLRWQRSREPALDSIVDCAIGRIVRCQGNVRVRDVAREFGLSERQLERRFDASMGLSPKTYARTVRFCEALEAMVKEVEPGRSTAGFLNGFTDQSHLIREFRSIAGATPRAFLTEIRRAEIVRGLEVDVGIVQYGKDVDL